MAVPEPARSTRVVRHFDVAQAVLFDALIDAKAIAQWRAPQGMSIEVHAHDARLGGRFRVTLTYLDEAGRGKSTRHSDTYHGWYETFLPSKAITEVIEFETDDVLMQGEMQIKYSLTADASGTQLEAVHSGLPPGISLRDNELGWSQSLDRLKRYLAAR
jgi:uncharacterized protein YndB with AHSA1/START domain